MPSDLLVRRFETGDQAEVRALILDGLGDHWGEIDPRLNPDLHDIASSYADGVVLTGWLDGRLVATGTLKRRSGTIAEIVRMSVVAERRRSGIGRRMTEELIEAARQTGFRRVILETTYEWKDVIAFYVSCGFEITHLQNGAFGPDVYFAMDIGDSASIRS